jgi:hypothetical protein
VKHLCSIILRITLYALLPALLPVTDSACCRLSQHTTYCLRFVLIPLLTAYCILPAVLFAQAGWGPDVRLTYRQGAGRDPRAACCGDTIHIVWWQSYAPGHDEVFYKRSTDAGLTWEADTRLTPEDSISCVSPKIAVWGPNVHVIWYEYSAYHYALCYIMSTNGGETWGIIDTLRREIDGGWGDCWLSVRDSNVYVVFIREDSKMVFMRSTDNGVNWSGQQEIGNGSGNPRLEVFKTSSSYLASCVRFLVSSIEIYFYRSINGGTTWFDSQMVSENDTIGSQAPSMDTDDSSGIHIVWYDYKYSPYPWTGDIFYRVSRDSGNTWEPIDSLTIQHRARHSDILAEGNNLHVVWDDDRYGIDENNEILYRMSADLGQSWENDVRLTEAEGNSHNPALTCDSNYLHLFWCDCRDTTGDVAIYYKRKDLAQGVVELESLVSTLHLWFELYPTLFSKAITIRYSAWGRGQRGLNQAQDNPAMPYALWVKVYDITGKEVIAKRETEKGSNGETVQIDTKALPCGVYFVELQAGDVREVHKVLKVK